MFVLYYVIGINNGVFKCMVELTGKYIYRIRFIYFVQRYKYIFEKHINVKIHYKHIIYGFSVKK